MSLQARNIIEVKGQTRYTAAVSFVTVSFLSYTLLLGNTSKNTKPRHTKSDRTKSSNDSPLCITLYMFTIYFKSYAFCNKYVKYALGICQEDV
jgi:hypothetical protein